MKKNTINVETQGANSPGIVFGDYNQTSIISDIEKKLLTFSNFYNLFKSFKTVFKHYFDNININISDISDRYFSHDLSIGQQISIKGFLSKYLPTYRSKFYTPFSNKTRDIKINVITNRVSWKVESFQTQLPVQVFPPVIIDGKQNWIYFLYPEDMSSFLMAQDNTKVSKFNKDQEAIDDVFKISSVHQPLLVISNINLANEIERIVKITGTLSCIDEDLSNIFLDDFSQTQRTILFNSFRPFNEDRTSLCLDLRDSHRSRISTFHSLESLPALIYAESHFENLPIENESFIKIMGESLPKALPTGLYWHSFNSPNIFNGSCDSNVSISTSDHVNYSYSIQTDLKNRTVFSQNLSELHMFINSFRQNAQNKMKKISPKEIKNHFDFVYDYSKSKLFHPEGVLVSKEIQSILKKNEHCSETIDWMKNVKG
ncbi:hypothetical protein [Desulforegula conservatrix]|uniref:hypothetical protein n=1 Tax=Desulforegula conservatrix TaxID=153026 RepID=UPI00040D65B1|nr:hypothetical protein [Desulforegula conservatrix]